MTLGEIIKKYSLSPSSLESSFYIEKITFTEVEKTWFFGTDTTKTISYINLALLLNYIENNQNLFTSNNSSINLPFLKFDIHPDNFMLTFPGQISSDPKICLLPNENLRVFQLPDADTAIKNAINKFSEDCPNEYIGRLMYLFFSIEYLGSTLFELANEKGEIILENFLKRILDDTNKCLGGVNKLTYKIFDNVVKIIEEASLKYDNLKEQKDYARFNVYGVRPNEGSFVKNIDFNVTITNDMATMVTIGAQANGNQPSVDSTALSKFNKGLIDRTKNEVTTDKGNTELEAELSTGTTQSRKAETEYATARKKYNDAKNNVYKKKLLTSETIETLTNFNSDFAKEYVGRLTENEQIPAPFFLPFDLNLTMMGLSGIRIFEKFALTEGSEKILPSYYRDNNGKSIIDFIVFDLKHSIKNNKWETTIKGKSIPSETSLEPKPVTKFTLSQEVLGAGLQATRNLVKPLPQQYESELCQRDATIQISPNYNLAQLSCGTPVAQYSLPAPGQIKTNTRSGNITREPIITNLTNLATNVIEVIKAKYPTTLVTNAYRNKGGNSQHEVGEAVDLQFTDISGTISSQNALILTRAQEIVVLLDNYAGLGNNAYDQFLLEYKTRNGGRPWIHISYKKGSNRRDIRTFLNDTTAPNGAGKLYNPLA